MIRPFIVPPERKISLAKDYDPGYKADRLKKSKAKGQLKEGIEALAEYQDVLYAQNTHAVLIIFQAMDAAGKDSTITLRSIWSIMERSSSSFFSMYLKRSRKTVF